MYFDGRSIPKPIRKYDHIPNIWYFQKHYKNFLKYVDKLNANVPIGVPSAVLYAPRSKSIMLDIPYVASEVYLKIINSQLI